MSEDLVRCSRAGDMFHYRWAARRCLRMLDPKFNLDFICIESSRESTKRGEYVIDVAEYEKAQASVDDKVIYYQLKHSTKRIDEPFILSDLKSTFEGFGKRFLDIKKDRSFDYDFEFKIITNRKVKDSFLKDLEDISKGQISTKTFLKTLKKYTTINHDKLLKEFCKKLKIIETEGDYNQQRFNLSSEVSKLLAESSKDATIDSLVELIHKYSLPDTDKKKIRKENVLRILGVNSEKELFPAPNEMESIKDVIIRAQYDDIIQEIIDVKEHIIIHASGGVGKSILAKYLADNLSNNSVGLVYDCFGAGKYRNPQHPRHTHKFGIVQIINELASLGLCDFLIPQQTDSNDAFLRCFTERLKDALENLRKINNDAELAIIIDAADNAEMAAKEFNTSSFCKDILRIEFPEGCKLIELCRTERIDLLDPPSAVKRVKLRDFGQDESTLHCRKFFPNMSLQDCIQFHELTCANPRVQIYSLENAKNVSELLDSLGPAPISLDNQIGTYIEKAINQIKDNSTPSFRNNIEILCTCLASLPPFIPIDVLYKVSNITISEIKSFIFDLKKPILLSGNSIQFRDEPTETWFKKKYSATKEQLLSFVDAIKPLANETYVAEVLPFLLLQSGCYSELIDLAFSEEFLPKENHVDKRNIKLSRIQFAFKAALKKKCYYDAAKLALLAGEETAGEQRQLDILAGNIDLTTAILSENKVYEVAAKRKLKGNWLGSENVYSASMFSFIKEFEGEARAYLRSAQNWLKVYLEKRDEQKKDGKIPTHKEGLRDEEIAEMAFAYLNLDGVDGVIDFILSWSPEIVVFKITKYITKRLIDLNRFDEVIELCAKSKKFLYMMLAISDEMLEVGRFIDAQYLKNSLNSVCKSSKRIDLLEDHHYTMRDDLACGLLSLLEQCIRAKFSKSELLQVVRNYFPTTSFLNVVDDYSSYQRTKNLRAIALELVLNDNLTPDLNLFVPNDLENKSHDYTQKRDMVKRVLGDNLPWYMARLKAIESNKHNLDTLIKKGVKESRQNSMHHYLSESSRQQSELNNIRFDIVLFCPNKLQNEYKYFSSLLKNKDKSFFLPDRIRALRIICRNKDLIDFKTVFEQSCIGSIQELHSATEEGSPESISDYYIEMSRALLAIDKEDAACYFDSAIEIVSKYGDELIERWTSLNSIAEYSAKKYNNQPKLAYRFIRCTELVGENVAREKYIDRNRAIVAAMKLFPPEAFATLSRWKDRHVGYFDRLLPAILKEAVSRGLISSDVGWSFTSFDCDWGMPEFLEICFEKERDSNIRQKYLDDAIRKLALKENYKENWIKLRELAQRYSLDKVEIQNFYMKAPLSPPNSQGFMGGINKKKVEYDWIPVFDGLNLTVCEDIDKSINNYKESTTRVYEWEVFWQEFFSRLHESNAREILITISLTQSMDIYHMIEAIRQFPNSWRQKISVQQNWDEIIYNIGKVFAINLCDPYGYYYNNLENQFQSDNQKISCIKGIAEGLYEYSGYIDARSLFGFVATITPLLSYEEATDVLEYGLSRIEEHIDDNFADGEWNEKLKLSEDVNEAVAGFIYASLGHPETAFRWEAVHCVRKLFELECLDILDIIFRKFYDSNVTAFIDNRFPFYELHAKQYFLIAAYRVSIDNTEYLKKYFTFFSDYALNNISHILIQVLASKISLQIEEQYPEIYNDDILEKLQWVGKSKFSPNILKKRFQHIDSYFHANDKLDLNLGFSFSYDFDRYWFEPLGNVFGISGKQIEEIARHVICHEWGIKVPGSYIKDYRHCEDTWSSHNSYPKIEGYSFYLSYHAMMAVASKLLGKMPIACYYDDDNEWQEWFEEYFLARDDGKWLSDRRDAFPVSRMGYNKKPDDWIKNISEQEFLDSILWRDGKNSWLHVEGEWQENQSPYKEDIIVSSAWVRKDVSKSLMYALNSFESTYDCYLQNANDGFEIAGKQFTLNSCFLKEDLYVENKLDFFDPKAGRIKYPPFDISDEYKNKFKLVSDSEKRKWFVDKKSAVVIQNEIWSSGKSGYDPRETEPKVKGNRLRISLIFLKQMCKKLNQDFILKVEIKRKKDYGQEGERSTPQFKVFVFSEDGTIRSSEACYKLR